jgi:hypothetical protein
MGAVMAAFAYLLTPRAPSALETSQELRAGEYAKTYVDFWDNIKTEYLDSYNYLDPISQESVRVHEGVHVQQLEAAIAAGWCYAFWGCLAVQRLTWDSQPAIEVPAFKAQLDFLNSKLPPLPRSEWTSPYYFREQVEDNLWRAKKYVREGIRG